MKIAAIQTNIFWNEPKESIKAAEPLMQEALRQGAEILVLPEMFSCGFSFVAGEAAHEISRISESFLLEFANKHNVVVVASYPCFASQQQDRPYNSLRALGPTGLLSTYNKIHLFTPAGESKFYKAGNEVGILNAGSLIFGLAVCYDLRFPGYFSKLSTEVHGFIVSANWPKIRHNHWRSLLVARAIETQAYIIGVNRVGSDPSLEYQGGSLIVSPLGEILAESGDREEVSCVDLSALEVKRVRELLPIYKDRSSFDL